MHELTKLFKALSDPNRLRILKMLEIKPLCVCEITEVLQLATSTVSKHLSILRDAGFINDARDGKWINYILRTNNKSLVLFPIVAEWLKSEEIIKQDLKKLQYIDRTVLCGM
jgi:ArsR family transcriptional regulator